MSARLLAYRPSSVVERLGPRSGACPISPRDLLGPANELGLVLPVIRAPIDAVARAALVAAKELQSVLGLALPAGAPAGRWFDAVARAADEVAGELPIFLCGEVIVEGEGATQVEQAFHEAWRLVEAGITHLAVDAAAVASGERGRVVGEIAQAGADRGIGIDLVISLADGAAAGARAAAVIDELARRGTPPELASVRCLAPADGEEARLQAGALARICQALRGVPVMRRGAVTPELLALLRGSPVKMCEDGGAASTRALGLIPWDLISASGEASEARVTSLERAAAELSDEGTDRLEARAYVDSVEFLEQLGARGSAASLGELLEARLEGGA